MFGLKLTPVFLSSSMVMAWASGTLPTFYFQGCLLEKKILFAPVLRKLCKTIIILMASLIKSLIKITCIGIQKKIGSSHPFLNDN